MCLSLHDNNNKFKLRILNPLNVSPDMRSGQTVAFSVNQLAVSLIGHFRMTTEILSAAQHQSHKVQLVHVLLVVEGQELPQLLYHLLHLWDSSGAVDQLGNVTGVLVHVGGDQCQQGDGLTSSYTQNKPYVVLYL